MMKRFVKTKQGPLRNIAYDAGRAMVGRRQSRRRRRGKPYMLPDQRYTRARPIMPNNQSGMYRGSRGPGGYSLSQRVMPARTNAQMDRRSGNTRFRSGEATNMKAKGDYAGPVPTPGTSGKTSDMTLVQPFNADLWPMLSDKAQNYTGYTVLGLRFIYQASKGSAYNGQITCGFTKETSLESGVWTDPDYIINLPVSMRFQASDTQNTMVVPANMMSQGGKNLFNPTDQEVAAAEPTRYYAGAFMYCCEGCTDDSDIGRWHVEYDIRLEQSQLNTNPPSAELRIDHDNITVVHSGTIVTRPSDGTTVRCSCIRNCLLMSMPPVNLTVNDEEVLPIYSTAEFSMFSLPKLRCADLGISATTGPATVLLFPAATPASLPAALATMATTTTTRVAKK